MSETLTGAHVLCRTLLEAGVDVLFGYPGGAIMPFYHALPEYPGLRHILVRHEQAAAHAADGYARASGRVGVCVATSGPGATNLVTGLVESLNAGVPLVVLVGDANRDHAGKNMTQEARQALLAHRLALRNIVEEIEDVKRRHHLGAAVAEWQMSYGALEHPPSARAPVRQADLGSLNANGRPELRQPIEVSSGSSAAIEDQPWRQASKRRFQQPLSIAAHAAEPVEVAKGVAPVDLDSAGRRLDQAGQQIEHRRLAATGLADDRDELARLDFEAEISYGEDGEIAPVLIGKALRDRRKSNDRLSH